MAGKNHILQCFIILIVIFFSSLDLSSGYEKWYSVYFTSPGLKNQKKNNPERMLVRLIENSSASISGAFYDIKSSAVTDALIKAAGRGVKVKLITERDNFNGAQVKRLLDAGIPLVTDNSHGLMHNKFAIIDDTIVWTGSYNITSNGSMKNNNNVIMIISPELADIYKAEFFEMFSERIFGNRKDDIPFLRFRKKYYVRIDDSHINAYFAPEDNVERIILKRINRAKKSVRFMAFSFTSDRIGEAIIRKHNEGVRVEGIFEQKGTGSRYSEYIKMKVEGVPVKHDRNRYNMHHKVIIIDDRIVITGSYNFSKNANKKNDENILIIDNLDIARAYLEEFYRNY